jgi:trans-aconitate methyltransferase
MDINYARERGFRRSTKYRLWRRTIEIVSALEEFAPKPVTDIIDLGTADGRMLHSVKKKFPESRCVGVEFNQELVDFGRSHFPEIEIVQGDVQALDFTQFYELG